MTTITLPHDLDKVIKRESEQSGESIELLVSEWLRQHLASLRRQRLAEQTRRFWNKHAELYGQYANKFVVFYDDKILDHDSDVRQLALLAQKQYGDLPIVIAQVTEKPVRSYKSISTHLHKVQP